MYQQTKQKWNDGTMDQNLNDSKMEKIWIEMKKKEKKQKQNDGEIKKIQ